MFLNYVFNFTLNGKNVITDIANEEQNINYNNLIFRSGEPSIKNFDFLKRFWTLYDLLINLLMKKRAL